MTYHHVELTLRTFDPFQHLTAATINALDARAVPFRLRHRELLYSQGETAHSLYCILRGGIRLVHDSPDGQQVTIKIHGASEILGVLAISGEFPYYASGEAVGETQVVALEGTVLRQMMGEYPELALTMMDLVVGHVHEAHGRIRQMMAERVDRRLARALLHYCLKFGRHIGTEISIEVPLTQQDLAQFCGATLETINRTLRGWQDSGWIRLSRQHIDVLHCEALQQIAEDNAYVVV